MFYVIQVVVGVLLLLKKKFFGCVLIVIIGGGLLLVLVLIMVIFVVIVLFVYNDYIVCVRIVIVVNVLQLLKQQVQYFVDDEGCCFGVNDVGFLVLGDFIQVGLLVVNIGCFNNGYCGIEVMLVVFGKSFDGDLLWLEYDCDSGCWECSGESDDKYLLMLCRG